MTLRLDINPAVIDSTVFHNRTSMMMSSINRDTIHISDNYVITTPPLATEPKECTGWFFFNNMKVHKDQTAQIDAKSGEKETFGQVLQRSIRTALHMSDKGVTRNDVITLCTKNHLNAAVPYIATHFLGATIASVDPSFAVKDMEHLLNTVRPKIVFTKAVSVPVLEAALASLSLDSEIVVFDHTDGHTPFSDFLEPHPNEEKFEPVTVENLKETAFINFSSGTTGLPKGICLSHYAMIGHVLNSKDSKSADPEAMQAVLHRLSFPLTVLGFTSLYWISAGQLLLGSVLDGHCRLLCEDFDAEEVWVWIHKYKPVMVMLTPVQAIEMLTNTKPVNVSSVLTIVIAGSTLSPEYITKLQKVFPETHINASYGQTEVSGPTLMFNMFDKSHMELSKRPDKLQSVGLPTRGASYKVVDTTTGKNLPPNQQGELRLKSPFVTNGYHNQDSSETFDEDGWLKTGDIVYYDEDFCFFVVDRIKEAFKYRGWFIAPTVLESELVKHPAVKIAVVVGIPKEDGHHPMGLVVLNEGFDVGEEEIERFVEERVPEQQRLRAGVMFIKEVPVTASGKVKRKELRDLVLAGKL